MVKRRCKPSDSNGSRNGNRYHEGEVIGRLITLNEDIKKLNEKQLEQMTVMVEKFASHDTYTRVQMAGIKEDYTRQFETLSKLFKWIIVPLILALTGIKVLEIVRILP